MSPEPASLLLTGATGSKSQCINGIFDPSSPHEFTNEQLLYVKRDDPAVCAAYSKTIESWCVQPVASKGTDVCYAFLKANQRIDACSTGNSIF